MADPHPDRDEGDDARTPRWVYVFGAVLLVLVVAFAVLHLMGRGLGGHLHG